MASKIPNFSLNNVIHMPALGFGTWAPDWQPDLPRIVALAALEAGYRHIDCAEHYGNEHQIGLALQEFLSNNSSVKRSDIFLTTKVWPHLCTPGDIEWSLEKSLKDLGVEYVDCFLVHWPIAAERNEDYSPKRGRDGKYVINKALTENPEPIWRVMEKLYESGKAKSIGVSNWTISGFEALLKWTKIKPMVNQIEIHPYLANNELVDYCFAHDIQPVAYSPLGSQDKAGEHGRIQENTELNALAKSKDMTIAQLLLAWGLKRGYPVIPKSANADRIRSNAQLVEISDSDFEVVNKVAAEKHYRFCNLKYTFGYDVWPEESR